MAPVVKICGLTRPGDVAAAARAGAWALGFVFAESRRRTSPEQVRQLLAQAGLEWPAARPLIVGVFGEASPEEVVSVARVVGLDGVQLHGRAGPTALEVREALESSAGWEGSAGGEPVGGGLRPGSLLIIRAVPVDPDEESESELSRRMAEAEEGADLLLLDTSCRGRFGGTGQTFPWELARRAAGKRRFLIAGGVTPENAAQALRQSGAWGVDVSGGVETDSGTKDEQLIRDLIAAVRMEGQTG